MVNEVTYLKEKRYEKEMKYERKVLRELSFDLLQERLRRYFHPMFQWNMLGDEHVEEYCLDIAIESFLLGARVSKRGKGYEDFQKHSKQEESLLIDTLYGAVSMFVTDLYQDGLYYLCQGYVQDWWKEGYRTAEKRRRLRLH
ncbi:DUF2521 family protein [Priestia megaterium]|uniref:DUF2521 family protein n=1 Tax=Priestia megaterium TaxID=1404 RepID=UPI0020B2624B|nr:DUF2521 family protein [Priestia megaterium]